MLILLIFAIICIIILLCRAKKNIKSKKSENSNNNNFLKLKFSTNKESFEDSTLSDENHCEIYEDITMYHQTDFTQKRNISLGNEYIENDLLDFHQNESNKNIPQNILNLKQNEDYLVMTDLSSA